jgi:hypothetical protein
MEYITSRLMGMGSSKNTLGKPRFTCFPVCSTNSTRWHGDIKPDNILEVQGKFKLTDPGFAKFVELDKSKEKIDSEPIAELIGGTQTYGQQSPDFLMTAI